MPHLGQFRETRVFGWSAVWEPKDENKGCQGELRLEFPRILNIHYILDPGKTFLGDDVTS
jgi:hypothetical protein